MEHAWPPCQEQAVAAEVCQTAAKFVETAETAENWISLLIVNRESRGYITRLLQARHRYPAVLSHASLAKAKINRTQ